MSYTLKVQKINVVYEAGDSVVEVVCYLSDPNGIAFKNSNNEVDTFIIKAPKTSIPGSGVLAYLTGLASDEIAYKYTKQLAATGAHNSALLRMSESDVKNLFVDLKVSGVGIATSANLVSIKSSTEILLSDNLTLEYTANTTAPSFTITGDVASASNIISNVSSVANVVNGMTISGYGIPNGATVLAINSPTSITMSQNALSTNAGITLTLATDSESQYLTSLNPAIFTTAYEDLLVSGPSLLRDTTILEVETTSRAKLIQNATGATTAGTYVISGSPTYSFDASNLVIDYSALQTVVDIIDFTEL